MKPECLPKKIIWSELDDDQRKALLRWGAEDCADLRGANLSGANLRGANLDFSTWPLWCGSTKVSTDERQSKQLCYHALKTSERELRAAGLWDKLHAEFISWVNEFHHADECGKLEGN